MSVEATVVNEFNWLKHHVILLGLVVLLVGGAVYGIESLIARHDAANAVKSAADLKAAQDQRDADQRASDAREARYAQLVVTLTGQLAQRQQQEKKIQQVAPTLSAAEAAQHIAAAEHGSAVAQGSSVVLDLPTSQKVVSDIETLPLVRQDLANTQTLYEGAQGEVTDLKRQVADEKDVEAKQVKACGDEKALLKAQARKAKGRWLIIGGLVVEAVRLVLFKHL